MSQQALYQVLSIHGYGVTRIVRDEKRLLLHCQPQPHRVCCPECGSRDVIRRGETERWIHNVPIGRDCTWIVATLPRVECRACRIVRQVHIPARRDTTNLPKTDTTVQRVGPRSARREAFFWPAESAT